MTATGAIPATAPTGPSGAAQRHRVALHGVTHVYAGRGGDVLALDHVDLVIEPGEFVSVVGPSGCGKSTLLGLIAGFHRPTRGRVTLGDEEIRGPGPDRGVVFQQPNLYPWMSVRENVALGPRLRHVRRAQRRAIADRLLALVGLAEFADHATYELSGGMQQRCQIARALANDPEILLMDEPFGALDALTRERMQDELLTIWRDAGQTVLFITHSVEEALYLGTRVLVMSPRPGRIVLDQPVPFPPHERDRALREHPEFVALRARIGRELGLA
ncbi:MAG: ABC transporter ATP-binding protein [Solirubrobacteraceae bacterium]|nr:ABC transporter ATP-binding protein [Solirubrobacteraceae bacterium]